MSSSIASKDMRVYSIERFKNTNYFTWNTRIEMFFRRNDSFSLVDGLDPNLGNTYLVALHLLSLHNDKTWLNILLHCGDVQFYSVPSQKNLKQDMGKIILEAHPFTKFLEGFQKVLDEATSLGLIINDKQFIILLLATLSLSFHLFISTHGHDPTSHLWSSLDTFHNPPPN